MLGDCEMMAMAATAMPERARKFYRDVLGLALREETPFALVFAGGGAMLRVQKVQGLTPQPFTALAWRVADIAETVRGLASKGVVFEIFAGLAQDGGVWSAPNGDLVAWFKDPDGNLLSLTQFA